MPKYFCGDSAAGAWRFSFDSRYDGATFVDDYAHLPSEIDAVIRAARDSGDSWQRVVAVFQPNRYHRIQEMWQEYAHAFAGADLVVLTDIYASGTVPIPGVTGKLIVNAVSWRVEDAPRVIKKMPRSTRWATWAGWVMA